VPIVSGQYGWWIINFGMLVLALGMWWFFRRKKWL